jgi:hypothetical protein
MDMNDIQAVDEVKELILEFVNAWKKSVMFLILWFSTSVTPECLWKMCLRLFNIKTLKGRLIAHKFSAGRVW